MRLRIGVLAGLGGLALVGLAGSAARAGERGSAIEAEAECGPGFLAVPGTRTCLRLAGQVRSDVGARMPGSDGRVRPQAGGRVTLDARTQTEHGPVRVVLQAGTGPR